MVNSIQESKVTMDDIIKDITDNSLNIEILFDGINNIILRTDKYDDIQLSECHSILTENGSYLRIRAKTVTFMPNNHELVSWKDYYINNPFTIIHCKVLSNAS